jgi:FkbM family methyltransferase
MLSQLLHTSAEIMAGCLPPSAKRIAHRHLPRAIPYLYRVLRGVTPVGDVETVVRGGLLKGRPFRCSLRDEREYWLGSWERDTQEVARSWIGQDATVFDIGLHKGFFTLIAASLAGPEGKVVAFEPHPANRQCAAANLALNSDLEKRVTIEPVAISDQAGTERFNCGHDGSSMASLTRLGHETGSRIVEVPTISLDEYVSRHAIRPDFLKMDIEGAELLALRGMSMTLSEIRPVILIEIHNAECAAELQRRLDEHQYVVKGPGDSGFRRSVSWTERVQYLMIPAERAAQPVSS